MLTEVRISGAELNTMSQMQLIGEYVMMYALEKLVRNKNSSISFYRKYYNCKRSKYQYRAVFQSPDIV